MRRVDRAAVDVPASLQPGGAGPDELVAARAFRNAPPAPPRTDGKNKKKTFTYTAYKGDDVRLALEALFHGKCAYCETFYAAAAPVDVEHYRPKGGVADEPGHGGYWWIAMSWENLLPSCIDCNRKRGQVLVAPSTSLATLAKTSKRAVSQAGKKDSFPLAATGVRAQAEAGDFSGEHALLLNPCQDDPATSLAYSFDPAHPAGLIVPTGNVSQQQRGAASIQVYGLNRQRLVEDRTRVLRNLEFLGDTVIELSATIEELEGQADAANPQEAALTRLLAMRNQTLAQMKAFTRDEALYASMASAWLDDFMARLASPA
ncbi:hypothetical protein PMI01_02775 [Caulobacter sp. AP07]|uniref:HNH endonuclease n=1 Tax=Caulobacter sp. AP07 TaxID=1144304 RepID=UPI0002721B36|nr:HNH endonuclease [Caulobacter sp. AP07]EJL31536.1 hypothetical protein PMI01_02775 [Caulobacter sp. AP07]